MKLRMKGNSVRLRLSQQEVGRLAEQGRVEETVDFGSSGRLKYSVATSGSVRQVSAQLNNSAIEVLVPCAAAVEWAKSDHVGISSEQAVSDSEILALLIEKDFQCLHGDTDEDSDSFPNPLAEAGHPPLIKR